MVRKKNGRPKIPLITPDLDEENLTGKLPPKPIDLRTVLYWMDLGATAVEIAGAHYCGIDTLNRRLKEHCGMSFAELKEKACGRAKIELRKNQFNLTKTNSSMGIWLGKQWLGQKENVSELKDLIVHELRAGIKQISQESGSEEAIRPSVETQSPLPDR